MNRTPARPVRLSHSQWLALDQMAFDIQSCITPENLVAIATTELPRLLSADWACWNEHDPKIRVMNVHITPGLTT